MGGGRAVYTNTIPITTEQSCPSVVGYSLPDQLTHSLMIISLGNQGQHTFGLGQIITFSNMSLMLHHAFICMHCMHKGCEQADNCVFKGFVKKHIGFGLLSVRVKV